MAAAPASISATLARFGADTMDYHPTPAAEAHRQRQIHAHVLRVIWCCIEARMHDLAGQAAAARDASLDAAANARCARVIAGVTGPVSR